MKHIALSIVLAHTIMYALGCNEQSAIKTYGGHYYSVSTERLEFLEAKTIAENNNGYLAIPNSSGENDFIKGLIGGNKEGWIGVYDPSYSEDYCFDSSNCINNTSRFKDINNNSLAYSNWNLYEPNNFVREYDTVNGVQQVSPLGEHWVALNGNNGKWYDVGNHAHLPNNPYQAYAVFEFHEKPVCFDEDDLNTDWTNKKCNTQIWDNTTGILDNGNTFNCLVDAYGNDYCPSALAPADTYWDYEDGYSVTGVGTVVDYTSKITATTYNVPIVDGYTWYNMGVWCRTKNFNYYNIFKNAVSNAGGTATCNYSSPGYDNSFGGYEYADGWCSYTGGDNIYMADKGTVPKNTQIDMKGGCNTGTVWGVTKGRAQTFSFGAQNTCVVELIAYSSEGLPVYACKNTNNISCESGYNITSYNSSKVCSKKINICPNGFTETTRTETSKGECKRTITYTYYEYLCKNELNDQYNNYVPVVTNSDTGKTDPNNTTINSSTLDNTLGSSTPPSNNCKRKGFTCNSDLRDPAFIDGEWKCSPFPCKGEDDTDSLDTQVGNHDKKNDGWDETGECLGTIYIFNGNSNACRSWDLFFGLAGGGCCDKDKVFMGLVECKKEEKALAKKNKFELCTEVGEFCSRKLKFPKICIQKKKSYCCFSSKLARIIVEEGKPQLGMDFGSPESPECRGFTPEEFQKIDFSKIDISGAIDIPDVSALQTDIQNTAENLSQNLKNMYKE